MIQKTSLYLIPMLMANIFCLLGAAEKPADIKKVEKDAVGVLGYEIAPLLHNFGDPFIPFHAENIKKAQGIITNIINSFQPFKNFQYIITANNYLTQALAHISRMNAQQTDLERALERNKALNLTWKAEETIKSGEIPIYKTSKEEKRDFYNRVTTVNRNLDVALTALKLKEPDIKKAKQVIEDAKNYLRPFLKYQVIKRVDIFLTIFALKYLDAVATTKDRLGKLENVQHAILSIAYAQEFLDDAAKDLKSTIS